MVATGLVYPSTAVREFGLDANYVYWTSWGNGVYRAPRAGGSVQTVVSISGPIGLAVDSQYVYVTSAPSNAVVKVAKAGGAAQLFAADTAPQYVTTDATTVYWTSQQGVLEQPKAGGGATTLVDYTGTNELGEEIAVDDTYVYWTTDVVKPDNGIAFVYKMPKLGGSVSTLAELDVANSGFHLRLRLAANRLFVSSYDGIFAMDLAQNCGAIKLGGLGYSQGFAPKLDGSEVITELSGYSPNSPGTGRLTVSAAPNISLVSSIRGGVFIADQAGLYWADKQVGAIHSLPW